MTRRIGVVALCLAAAGFACAEQNIIRRGDELMERGQFVEAETEYRAAAEKSPNDASIAAKIRQARISALFQQAQRLHFDGELMKANMLFREIVRQAPESEAARDWVKKSDRDISRQYAQEGKEYLGVRSYESAIHSFEKALEYDPENDDAKGALDRAKTIMKWRAEKGADLWKAGLLEGAQGHPLIAETAIQNSLDLAPDRAHAEDYLSDMRTALGEERYHIASAMEKAGQWNGAADKYKEAKIKQADVADLDTSISKMESEVKADKAVRNGRLALAKSNFELATKFFEDAKALTTDPKNVAAIEAFLVEVQEKRGASLYRAARDLEMQGQIEEAIAAFRALDKEYVAYADARERVDHLERDVLEPSTKLYDQAVEKEKAGDVDGAKEAFKKVLFLNPFFRDARERLKKIDATLRAKAR